MNVFISETTYILTGYGKNIIFLDYINYFLGPSELMLLKDNKI